MPQRLSDMNLAAWKAWKELDTYGRDIDTMAGNPLPLRLEAMELLCKRYFDPDAIRWRVLQIEELVLKQRWQEKAKKVH